MPSEALVEAIKRNRTANGKPLPKKVIAVCTPTLGKVSIWWTTGMVDLIWPMNTGRAFIPLEDQVGNEIAELRNRLVVFAQGMEKANDVEVDSLMWIDDDVIFNRAVILALAQHDVPIASGVYFCKAEFPQPLIFGGPASGTMPFRPNETFEAYGWAHGLCLIKMDVYRRMEAECDLGKDKYGNPAWYAVPTCGFDESGGLVTGGTEDFKFFRNAHQLGYRPLVDCSKHAFGFHYDLDRKLAFPEPQWKQYVKREPITWTTKEGTVQWD